MGGFHAQDNIVPRLSFNQAPLTPSAPFNFWIGHIDNPTTISNAYSALSTQLDVGTPTRQQHDRPLVAPVQTPWVLDIDLDAFMPATFSHRVRSRWNTQ